MTDNKNILKSLTEAHGVSGYEAPVRALVRDLFEPLGELSQDKLGSVICKKAGSTDTPKVMLAGHMDEIGQMVKLITKEGFLKFITLGGWFSQVLLGQRVIVQTKKGEIPGIIGAKPPHLLPADERNKVVQIKDMYIDVGVSSKEEAEELGIRQGDPVVPDAKFVEMAGGKTWMSKAFDDRVGVAAMVSALTELQGQDHPNTIYAASTVMEEVGLRGATTSVRAIDPDVAIILESDIAGDVPGISDEQSAVKLGKGPTVLLYDVRMIPNLALRDMVLSTADEMEIPVQLSYTQGGATDGGAIHIHNLGVPTVVIGVAARHIHSDSSIIHSDDYENAVKLVVELIKGLDAKTVAGLTA